MEKMTNKEAKSAGLKVYNSYTPCKVCGNTLRLSNNGGCNSCAKLRSKQWAEDNKDRRRDIMLNWKANNQERKSQLNKEYEQRYPERVKESKKKWNLNNKASRNHNLVLYRTRKLNATPVWLSETQLLEILNFYKIAKWYEMFSNEKYHVDHIIPLRGKNVCGLHVPWNLQVLTASKNYRKNNKVLEDDQ